MRALAKIRKGKGYTLDRLSRETSIAKSHINNFEHEKVGISPEGLLRIAKVLRTTVEEISRIELD